MNKNLSTTYKEEADNFIASVEPTEVCYEEACKIAIKDFAQHLDSFAVLDDKLKILAYEKSREIDGEVLKLMAKEVPVEKIREIVEEVHAKYKLRRNVS